MEHVCRVEVNYCIIRFDCFYIRVATCDFQYTFKIFRTLIIPVNPQQLANRY